MGAQVSVEVSNKKTPAKEWDEKRALASTAAMSRLSILNISGEGDDSASLTQDALSKWTADFEANPTLQLSRLVLSKSDPLQSLSSRKALLHDPKVFNLNLKGIGPDAEYPGPRVSQAASGRCWLFATTNVLRYNVIEQLRLGDFELSQSYLFFYDKLEKANYYLENILDTLDEPTNGRLISYLNQAPVNDGGQWDMAVNIIEKYGIIPKQLYPESFSSSASSKLDTLLTAKLREYASILRTTSKLQTSNLSSLRRLKSKFLAEVHTTLTIALGTPPKPDEKLTWDYTDRHNVFHTWSGSPKEFYEKWGKRKGMDPGESFSLINDPRNEYGRLYSVDRLGNVYGGRPISYVNAPITALEDAVIAGIKANTPLFFGCDVGKSSTSVEGVMDTEIFDLKAAYGYELGMNKAQRLEMGDSSMTHAMVITAVHLSPTGRPPRYKVENSWGEDRGEKGWFMMTADWFKENVFQVVIPKSIAEKKWVEVLEKGERVMLDAWDPMCNHLAAEHIA